jgi:hypothetical protein
MNAARLSKNYFSKKNIEAQTFSEFLKASATLQSLPAKTPEQDLEDDGGGDHALGGGVGGRGDQTESKKEGVESFPTKPLKDKAESTPGEQEGALREDLPHLMAALRGIETEVSQIVEGHPLLSSGFEGGVSQGDNTEEDPGYLALLRFKMGIAVEPLGDGQRRTYHPTKNTT